MASGSARQREFAEVALPHTDALFNLALHLTRDRRDAEDLVQEALLKAFRFFDSYEPGTQIRAWLFRILRNTFINRYRAAKVRPQEVNFAHLESTYDRVIDETLLGDRGAMSPERLILDHVLDEEVDDALGRIPEEYRTVVIMALVEDMTYREIADTLSIPVGTVMSRLHRGRKALQASLLDYARRRGIVHRESSVPNDEEPAS